jgi:hypothetical protein
LPALLCGDDAGGSGFRETGSGEKGISRLAIELPVYILLYCMEATQLLLNISAIYYQSIYYHSNLTI